MYYIYKKLNIRFINLIYSSNIIFISIGLNLIILYNFSRVTSNFLMLHYNLLFLTFLLVEILFNL